MKQNRWLRLTALILSIIFFVLPLASGCTHKQSPDELADKSTQYAQKEKMKNVFQAYVIPLPENCEVSSGRAVSRDDRIHMIVMETLSKDPYIRRSLIYSTDMNGENLESEEYIPHIEGGILTQIVFLDDGSQLFLEFYYDYETNDRGYYLIKEDVSGETIFAVDLLPLVSNVPSDEVKFFSPYANISAIYTDSENRIYALGDSSVVVLSPDGQKLCCVDAGSMIYYSFNIDGKVAVSYRNSQLKRVCEYIDVENKTFGDRITIPNEGISSVGTNTLSKSPDDTSDYFGYYNTNTGLYGISEAGLVEVVNWFSSGINPNEVSHATVFGDGSRIFCQGYDLSIEKNVGMLLTKVPDDEVKEKYVINLACSDDGFGFLYAINYITKFNLESEDYRINVVEYSATKANSEMTSNELLNRDINIGNIPDMFLFDRYFSGDIYDNKGLFVDLYELIEADSDIQSDSFAGYACEPFETDGKLYKLADQIYVQTYAVRTDIAGAKNSMSISEMLDFLDQNSDLELMYGNTRSRFFSNISLGLNEFIDYEQAICTFSSDTFIRLLNYAAALPEKIDSDPYLDNYMMKKTGLSDGKFLLQAAAFRSFIDYLEAKAYLGDTEVTYVGYPGTDGRSSFYANCMYSISAKSEPEIQRGAWEFMKYLLRTQGEIKPMFYQLSGFPSSRQGYEKMAEGEMEQYYVVSADGGLMSRLDHTKYTDEEVAVYGGVQVGLTSSDADEIFNYMESHKAGRTVSDKIMEIINEETSGLFGGAKTAQETADIIQSRVSIYLSESN